MDTIQNTGNSPAVNVPSGKAVTVLVAEDDQFLADAYGLKLKNAGFEILFAKNGEEALEILKTSRPDVIILDIMMPRLNGFEVLESIRKQELLKSTPVFIASNSDSAEGRQRAMSLGAVEYIVKTNLSLNELTAKIQAALASRSTG